MLYLLNISGAFIARDFQLPFVLKVFSTSHSLILLIPINIIHIFKKAVFHSRENIKSCIFTAVKI